MPRTPLAAALCAAWLLPLAAGAGSATGGPGADVGAAPVAGPATPAAPVPDWNAVADVDVVNVVSRDEDGDPRDTKVWLAVVDGEGYIRTGNTTWGGNVVRDPRIVLRIAEREYPLRAEFVEDDALRKRVGSAFREKYGFQDSLLSILRGGRPKIMHLVAR